MEEKVWEGGRRGIKVMKKGTVVSWDMVRIV